MDVFIASEITGSECFLDKEESHHCVGVLRHRTGDEIRVIDGRGTMFECTITEASDKGVIAHADREYKDWGGHPYNLTVAVCPTKNIDRFEWFVEKATELGVDKIVPLVCEHSERRVLKEERLRKITVSACKQSKKAKLPEIEEITDFSQFMKSLDGEEDTLKLLAHCTYGDRLSIGKALLDFKGAEIIVLIGPEGDFSGAEINTAIEKGFKPIHLGSSILRTETAALTAVEAVYLTKTLL